MDALFWRNAFMVLLTCVWWMIYSVHSRAGMR